MKPSRIKFANDIEIFKVIFQPNLGRDKWFPTVNTQACNSWILVSNVLYQLGMYCFWIKFITHDRRLVLPFSHFFICFIRVLTRISKSSKSTPISSAYLLISFKLNLPWSQPKVCVRANNDQTIIAWDYDELRMISILLRFSFSFKHQSSTGNKFYKMSLPVESCAIKLRHTQMLLELLS